MLNIIFCQKYSFKGSWSFEIEQESFLFDEIEVLLYYDNKLQFKSSLTIVTDLYMNSAMTPTIGHLTGGTMVSIVISDLYLVEECDLIARVRPFAIGDGDPSNPSKELFLDISTRDTYFDQISCTLRFPMPPYADIVADVENNIGCRNNMN